MAVEKAVIVKRSSEFLQWNTRNHEYISNRGMLCCCFSEISGIEYVNDPFTTLVSLAYQQNNSLEGGEGDCCDLASVVLFTTAREHPAGDELAAYIEKNKLGKVTYTGPYLNENSKNNVCLFQWVVDRKAWNEFCTRIDNLIDASDDD